MAVVPLLTAAHSASYLCPQLVGQSCVHTRSPTADFPCGEYFLPCRVNLSDPVLLCKLKGTERPPTSSAEPGGGHVTEPPHIQKFMFLSRPRLPRVPETRLPTRGTRPSRHNLLYDLGMEGKLSAVVSKAPPFLFERVTTSQGLRAQAPCGHWDSVARFRSPGT